MPPYQTDWNNFGTSNIFPDVENVRFGRQSGHGESYRFNDREDQCEYMHKVRVTDKGEIKAPTRSGAALLKCATLLPTEGQFVVYRDCPGGTIVFGRKEKSCGLCFHCPGGNFFSFLLARRECASRSSL